LDQEGLIKEDDCLTAEYGPFTFLRPKDPLQIDSIIDTLRQGANGRYRVFKRDELPESWHFNNPSRLGDIIIACEPAHFIAPSAWKVDPGGAHGYCINDEKGNVVNDSMRALFMVSSPKVTKSVQLKKSQHLESLSKPYPRFYNVDAPVFENLDVYPFLCSLLDIPPAPNNATSFLIDTLLA